MLVKNNKHTIEVVVDRFACAKMSAARLSDSPGNGARALGWSGYRGRMQIAARKCCSPQNYACPDCGISIEEIYPRMFSFNSPFGACPDCTGLGTFRIIDPIAGENPGQGAVDLAGGAIRAWDWRNVEATCDAALGWRTTMVLLLIRLGHPQQGQRQKVVLLRSGRREYEDQIRTTAGHLRCRHHVRGRCTTPGAPLQRNLFQRVREELTICQSVNCPCAMARR